MSRRGHARRCECYGQCGTQHGPDDDARCARCEGMLDGAALGARAVKAGALAALAVVFGATTKALDPGAVGHGVANIALQPMPTLKLRLVDGRALCPSCARKVETKRAGESVVTLSAHVVDDETEK